MRAASSWSPCRATRPSCPRTSSRACAPRSKRAGADLAVAKTGEQPHPVFCLMRRGVHASLARLPRLGPAQDRQVVRGAARGRGRLRRRGRRLRQHQHPRRARGPREADMTKLTITQASCADDYDPNSMPVDKARAFIHRFLEPLVAAILRVPIRDRAGPRARRGRGLAGRRAVAPQLRDGRLGDARRGPEGRRARRRSRRSARPSPAARSRARSARGSACAS